MFISWVKIQNNIHDTSEWKKNEKENESLQWPQLII